MSHVPMSRYANLSQNLQHFSVNCLPSPPLQGLEAHRQVVPPRDESRDFTLQFRSSWKVHCYHLLQVQLFFTSEYQHDHKVISAMGEWSKNLRWSVVLLAAEMVSLNGYEIAQPRFSSAWQLGNIETSKPIPQTRPDARTPRCVPHSHLIARKRCYWNWKC